MYLAARVLATIAPNGASERIEYHHPDRLGTRLVTNNQDTTSFEQVTLPFGTALDAESTGSTKRRFTSYDRSTVTGLDYAVNRHYDPLQGRFAQVDPIGMASTSLANPQTLNLYAYCTNDPINHADPSGLGFFSFLKKVFGFFAKIAKWIAIIVAVVVLVAVALQTLIGIEILPVIGDILSKLLVKAGGKASSRRDANLRPANCNPGSRGTFIPRVPRMFDNEILKYGQRAVKGSEHVEYSLPGFINNSHGVYEIGVNPATNQITHRFFRPLGKIKKGP